jgi:hypothetical protein
MNQRIHYMYGQDDWRVSNRLTLNLGLRYELGTPPFETNNQLSNYNPVTSPTTSSLVVASAGSIYNRALINRNNLNIAPRVGFAYELDNKTVVRGGYGIGYQQFLRAATVNELAQNAPYNIDNVITQYAPQSKTSPQAVCTSLTVAPTSCFMPTQNGYPNSFLSTSNYSPLSTTTTYDPAHSPTPYVQSFQLSVQREIAPKTFLPMRPAVACRCRRGDPSPPSAPFRSRSMAGRRSTTPSRPSWRSATPTVCMWPTLSRGRTRRT